MTSVNNVRNPNRVLHIKGSKPELKSLTDFYKIVVTLSVIIGIFFLETNHSKKFFEMSQEMFFNTKKFEVIGSKKIK